MRKVVIYPGRFHPFHKGHKSVYDYLVKKYGAANVFVVSSGTQAPMTSPFSFADKKEMMVALGVPRSQITQVKSPYQAREVTEKFDSETTAVIFAVSEKDSERFNFKPKKDGSPSYMQPLGKKLEPMNTHGYVELVPTATFSIAGKEINSASQIRAMYMNSNDEGRMNIIAELYGEPNEKIKRIFDTELKLAESILRVKKYAPLMESSFGTAFNRIMREVNELEEIVEAENTPTRRFINKASEKPRRYIDQNTVKINRLVNQFIKWLPDTDKTGELDHISYEYLETFLQDSDYKSIWERLSKHYSLDEIKNMLQTDLENLLKHSASFYQPIDLDDQQDQNLLFRVIVQNLDIPDES